MARRAYAASALACVVIGAVLLIVAVLANFSHAVAFAILVVIGTSLAWNGLVRTGILRLISWLLAAAALVGSIVLLLTNEVPYVGIGALVAGLAGVALSKRAFRVHVRLPHAEPPRHPVMIYNPKSGGGVADRVGLAEAARARGIEPIELTPGTDLRDLVHDAIARGADGLMAAGGDGTQAIVASIAADHQLPFACIPAGTRNHFALDLGVDRRDVVGALGAFVNGGEKRVDLAEVNGRVFVNNVSIGVYAEAVQQDTYRDAKIRTLLRTLASALPSDGTRGPSADLTWVDPAGKRRTSAVIILIANNPYRLNRAIGSGTRPRLDGGVLGITIVGVDGGARSLRSEWSASTFEVDAPGDVPIGLDGEALVLPAPLRFASRPGALRVRIAPDHPGASPSAEQPDGPIDGIRLLVRLAFLGDR